MFFCVTHEKLIKTFKYLVHFFSQISQVGDRKEPKKPNDWRSVVDDEEESLFFHFIFSLFNAFYPLLYCWKSLHMHHHSVWYTAVYRPHAYPRSMHSIPSRIPRIYTLYMQYYTRVGSFVYKWFLGCFWCCPALAALLSFARLVAVSKISHPDEKSSSLLFVLVLPALSLLDFISFSLLCFHCWNATPFMTPFLPAVLYAVPASISHVNSL